MGLKDTWIDKVNGESYVLADDINAIAHQAILNEENIEEKPDKSDLEKVAAESGNVLLGEETGEIISLDDVSPKEHLVKVGLRSDTLSDDTAVTVKTCGKNIINIDTGLNSCFTKDGDVYTLTKNGSNRFSGRIPCFIPANQKFCFSADFVEYTGNYRFWIQAQIININGSYDPGGLNLATGSTVYCGSRTGGLAYVSFYLELSDPDGTVIRFKNLQIEIGDTKTAYEPYKEGQTVTTTLADGATLQSIAPNMTVSTDTSGVQIEAEYNRDINIVIDKLTNAILALGGNV